MLEWNESFSVGNAAIDAQHKKLLAMLSTCEGLLNDQSEQANEQFHILLHELSAYVHDHFAFEESLLRRCDYPKLSEHIDEHEGTLKSWRFVWSMQQFRKMTRQGLRDC